MYKAMSFIMVFSYIRVVLIYYFVSLSCPVAPVSLCLVSCLLSLCLPFSFHATWILLPSLFHFSLRELQLIFLSSFQFHVLPTYNVCVYIYVCLHMYVHMPVYRHVCTHVYTYTHMYIHTHMYTLLI